MYDGDYENGLLSEADAVLTQALTAIGLLSVHGDIEGYRDDAIEALRELGMMMEDGAVPFIGCARLSLEMVENYADDVPRAVSDDYFQKSQDFAHMFVAGIPMPSLKLVGDDEDED